MARTAYVAVPKAPVGLVHYLADGKPAGIGACRENLVLGPLSPGATVRSQEDAIGWLLWLRVGVLVLGAAALVAVGAIHRVNPVSPRGHNR